MILTSAPLQPNERRNRVSNLQVVKSSHGHLITPRRVHLDQSWGTRVGQGEHALVCQIMHTRDNQHLQWTNTQYLTQTAVGYLKTNKLNKPQPGQFDPSAEGRGFESLRDQHPGFKGISEITLALSFSRHFIFHRKVILFWIIRFHPSHRLFSRLRKHSTVSLTIRLGDKEFLGCFFRAI